MSRLIVSRVKTWHKITLSGAATLALAAGIAKGYEGLRHHEYSDVGGVPTICYGHTGGVKRGQTDTQAQCNALLTRDMNHALEGVLGCLDRPMTQGQQAAFGDLAYNIGVPRFCRSSIARRFNAGDIKGACAAIKWYVYASGVRLPGLVRRRQSEYVLCMRPG